VTSSEAFKINISFRQN